MSLIQKAWALARGGDLKGGLEAARFQLAAGAGGELPPADVVELHLVMASCALRLGQHGDAAAALDAAERTAVDAGLEGPRLRVEVWRAEMAYFQGRYSTAVEIVDRVEAALEAAGDKAYAAVALRIRIAVHLARAEYERAAALGERATALAESSGDAYVTVQVLNILGAVHFDRATAALLEPHARSHLSLLDPRDAAPMEGDVLHALGYFERARVFAEEAGYEFAAWYVAGNIERLEILLGRAESAVRKIRRRLEVLQAKGARYDEIVTRSNLAWALRTLGLHREALHELDVALVMARETGTFNVLLEFLHYDRSVVLDALGEAESARDSYRAYLRMVGAWNRKAKEEAPGAPTAPSKRPLEPYYLKRADRFIAANLGGELTMAALAEHCGVSERTLQKAFSDFRGTTPVAHVRNVRLDAAHRALQEEEGVGVAQVAKRFGFGSVTTFTLAYRKRFGAPPSRTRKSAVG